MGTQDNAQATQSARMNLIGDGISAGTSLVGGLIGMGIQQAENEKNRKWSSEEAAKARLENFEYGEFAANAADRRQRNQYWDLYSPEAYMLQLQKAGLSPSLIGGTPPSGGSATGQQGGGASGAGAPQAGYASSAQAMIGGAGLAQMASQVDLNKALANEANAKAKTEEGKQIAQLLQNEMQEMTNTKYKHQFGILNLVNWTDNGKPASLFDWAKNSENFNAFKNQVWKACNDGGISESMYKTEETTQTLRNYYEGIQKYETNLTTLANIGAENEFYTSLTKALNTEDFINLSVQDAKAKLKASVETNNLTEEQKGAWNRLLNRMEDGTTKDILIVCGLMINNALTNYNAPTIINRRTNNNITAGNNIQN